jgi:glycosyltransferase involved in cell wall biosynthesis
VSSLLLTRAGTARYVERIRETPGVEIVPLSWGRAGRAAAAVRDLWWYPVGLPRTTRRSGLDVLHCPTFRGPLRSPGVPVVVTVHDLAVLRHPETFNLWSRHSGRVCVSRVVRAARLVIAVSEFTKRELVDALGLPETVIRVVANGVSASFTRDGPAESGDYVLAVGTLEPRKNLRRLVEATRSLGTELRIVGARGWGRVDVCDEHVRWLGEVSDERLARLYRGCRVFAYPSLYEGFGLPVLEAMACGAPVVTSRGGATEEVSGGGAVLVDPLDVAGIAGGIEEAAARRGELSATGPAVAAAYSWAETARRTADVYREVAA